MTSEKERLISWNIRQHLKELKQLERSTRRNIREQCNAPEREKHFWLGSLLRIQQERRALGTLHWKLITY